MSIRSRYCARAARASTTPVSWSMRSARVDLPWSMCAMMQKLRMIAGSVWPGFGTDTGGMAGTGFSGDSRSRGWTGPLFHSLGTVDELPGLGDREAPALLERRLGRDGDLVGVGE